MLPHVSTATGEKKISSWPGSPYTRSAGSAILVLALFLCLYSSAFCAGESVPDRKVFFAPGEKLTYEGKWGPIPAGEVTLEVLPRAMVGGNEAYHFAMTTKTIPAVDLIYKIRERQESFVDTRMTHSVLYKKREEGKYPRDIIVTFDWQKREALRSNFGEKSPPIPILPGTFDPLAMIYFIRLQDLKENSVIEIPVTDGHMNIGIKATVGQKTIIEVGGKKYPALEVIPDMERLEGLVKKSENPQLRIWYADDEKKIPLRIVSSVKIFSFVFELTSVSP